MKNLILISLSLCFVACASSWKSNPSRDVAQKAEALGAVVPMLGQAASAMKESLVKKSAEAKRQAYMDALNAQHNRIWMDNVTDAGLKAAIKAHVLALTGNTPLNQLSLSKMGIFLQYCPKDIKEVLSLPGGKLYRNEKGQREEGNYTEERGYTVSFNCQDLKNKLFYVKVDATFLYQREGYVENDEFFEDYDQKYKYNYEIIGPTLKQKIKDQIVAQNIVQKEKQKYISDLKEQAAYKDDKQFEGSEDYYAYDCPTQGQGKIQLNDFDKAGITFDLVIQCSPHKTAEVMKRYKDVGASPTVVVMIIPGVISGEKITFGEAYMKRQ